MFIAAFIAASIPAIFFLLLGLTLEPQNGWAVPAMLVAFVVSFTNIVLIGIPVTLFLRRFQLLNWPSMLASGFIIGALFYSALVALSVNGHGSYSLQSGSDWLVVDGITTAAGWRQHFISAIAVGILGLVVGAIYYVVLLRRSSSPNQSFKDDMAKATHP